MARGGLLWCLRQLQSGGELRAQWLVALVRGMEDLVPACPRILCSDRAACFSNSLNCLLFSPALTVGLCVLELIECGVRPCWPASLMHRMR